MKKFMSAVAVLAVMAGPGAALAQDDHSQQAALTRTVAALDAAVFDAFNTCSKPVQLEKHASFFAPGVEFYHDAGGVTWSRREMIENTQKYVCGHFRRELVPGTLKVFPISNYGRSSRARIASASSTPASATGSRTSSSCGRTATAPGASPACSVTGTGRTASSTRSARRLRHDVATLRRRIIGRLQYRHDADGLFGRNRIGAIARDRVGQFRV
ncbi:MAG TPA: hypothetical protein VGD42_10750, partial [Lysobacter sp.]